jgi:hypothetical protein
MNEERPTVFFLSSYSGSNDPHIPSSSPELSILLSLTLSSLSITDLACLSRRQRGGGGGKIRRQPKKCWASSYIYSLCSSPPPTPHPCVEKFVMVRKVQVLPTIRPQPWALYYIYTIYNMYTPPPFFSPLPLPLSYSFFLQ